MAGGISQLYPDTGVFDALKIQGKDVSGIAPSDGQGLVFNGQTQEWVPNLASIVNSYGGAAAGTGASADYGGAIGNSASSHNGGAVGNLATTYNGGAAGYSAISNYGGSVGTSTNTNDGGAVGNAATSTDGGAVGAGATATDGGAVGIGTIATDGFAGGASASANGSGRVQLGTGTNSTNNTIQFLSAGSVNTAKWVYLANATATGGSILDAADALSAFNVIGATGTQTANNPATVSQTWNNAGVTFTAAKWNVTDTASNASSLLADFQVGGVSKANFLKNGNMNLGNGQFAVNIGTARAGWLASSTGVIVCGDNGFLGNYSEDTKLWRDAAGVWAQRNGTNAQTFRLYGTYTDASNYRRLSTSSTTGGRFTLAAQGAGTGANGNELAITSPVIIPAASVTPSTNGDLVVEATSNTTLTFKLKGSDGTVRSGTITLS
jgi:hypothetical protein